MADTAELMVLSCTCGQKMKVPGDAMGRTYKCVRCASRIKVSEGNSAPLPVEKKIPEKPQESQAPPPKQPERETPPAHVPIGQLLLDAGMITDEQLEEALRNQQVQGGKTFEILLALGYIDKDQLHAFLSRQPGIANIELSRVDISQELIELIPKKIAIENLVLPVDQLGKLLTVAMACPLDTATIQTLEKTTGLRVKAMLCRLEDIHAAVQKYYPERKKFELSPSAFDGLPGASAPKEKVEEKLKKWNGMLLSAERIKELTEKITPAEVTIELVAAIALSDPGFGAFLLRMANSELYGMRGQVDSVSMAVAILGKPVILRALAEIVEPADARAFPVIAPWFDLARRTGQIAQELSKECAFIGPHTAFSLGLIADLGRMALAMVSPLQYKRVKSTLHGDHLVQAEQRLFTMDHCEAAGYVAMQWHLPVSVSRPLQYYLNPPDAKELEPHARLLGLAAGLAHMNGAELEKKVAAYGASIEELGLSPEVIGRISKAIQ